MTDERTILQRRKIFWNRINSWQSHHRHENPWGGRFRENTSTPSFWGRWLGGDVNPNNPSNHVVMSKVVGKPLVASDSHHHFSEGHWTNLYRWASQSSSKTSPTEESIRILQRDFVKEILRDRGYGNQFAMKATRLSNVFRIPTETRYLPDEIFYWPTSFATPDGLDRRRHGSVNIRELYLQLAGHGWNMSVKRQTKGRDEESVNLDYGISQLVVEQAYVILDVTDDRVLLLPWLWQQAYHYASDPLHLHETFLLSVNRNVLERMDGDEAIRPGAIVCHGRDPNFFLSDGEGLPSGRYATWKGIHAENGVYDLCMLGNNAQTQGAKLFVLPNFSLGISDEFFGNIPNESSIDAKCNLFTSKGLHLLAEEPLSFINIVDGIEVMHNNFTISTDRHESSTPERPNWVDTWQDKRKTIQVDLRKINERISGGRSIITRCVECNQKAYIIAPSPNPDLGSADCPTCRGRGTLHFQNLLDGADIQSEFPMAGRR